MGCCRAARQLWALGTTGFQCGCCAQARQDKERYQRALSAYQQQQSAEDADATRAEEEAAAMKHAASLPLSPKGEW